MGGVQEREPQAPPVILICAETCALASASSCFASRCLSPGLGPNSDPDPETQCVEGLLSCSCACCSA